MPSPVHSLLVSASHSSPRPLPTCRPWVPPCTSKAPVPVSLGMCFLGRGTEAHVQGLPGCPVPVLLQCIPGEQGLHTGHLWCRGTVGFSLQSLLPPPEPVCPLRGCTSSTHRGRRLRTRACTFVQVTMQRCRVEVQLRSLEQKAAVELEICCWRGV